MPAFCRRLPSPRYIWTFPLCTPFSILYQFQASLLQKGGVHILELFLDFWIGKHLLHHPVRGKDLSMLLHPFLGFDQGNVLGLIRLQYYYGFLFF